MEKISYQRREKLLDEILKEGFNAETFRELKASSPSTERNSSNENEFELYREEFFVLKKGRYVIRLDRNEASFVQKRLWKLLRDGNEEEGNE